MTRHFLPGLLATTLALAAAACSQAPSRGHAADAAVERPAIALPAAGSPDAAAWLADVDRIADAADNTGRRAAIEEELDSLGLEWRTEEFRAGEHAGQNILADVGGPAGRPLLLLGAHSDRVDSGHGATDNATGSATVLALAGRLKREPLRNHRVAVAFWDLEERGLLGAKAYVAGGGERPALYVNFDVFGWGDTLWMRAGDADAGLVEATRSAAAAAGIGVSAGEQYPPTDHRAFLEAGWPAVSYSLVGAGEVPLILQMYAGTTPASPPKVMQVIHHERDTVAEIDPDAAARATDALEDALRQWDAAHTAAPPQPVAEH